MYCPKCGTEAISGTKYCRACGINLYPANLLLKGQNWLGASRTNDDKAVDIFNSRLMQTGFVLLFLGLVATIFFGVLEMNTLAGIASAILIAGAGLMGYPWVAALLNKELKQLSSNPVKRIESASEVKQFNTGQNHAIPSVTENTTKNLDENRYREKVLQERRPEKKEDLASE